MSRKDYYFFLRGKAVLTECSLVHVPLRNGSADSSGSLKSHMVFLLCSVSLKLNLIPCKAMETLWIHLLVTRGITFF